MSQFSPSYLPMNTVLPGCLDSRQSPETQHPSSWSCLLGKFFTLDWLPEPRLLPRLNLLGTLFTSPKECRSSGDSTQQEKVLQVGGKGKSKYVGETKGTRSRDFSSLRGLIAAHRIVLPPSPAWSSQETKNRSF